MHLFLNGGGDGEKMTLIYERFQDVIDRTKPLLYVPLAMKQEMYPGCLEWITGELKGFDIPGIAMITSGAELAEKTLSDYCAVFIGGGNTFKLLYELKCSGSFEKLKAYMECGGVIFGGSAGAIIFGEDIISCKYADRNEVALAETEGFDSLGGISLLCHYTSEGEEKTKMHTDYLLELSRNKKIIALPEEDTIIVTDDTLEIVGTRPYYVFENGVKEEKNPGV